MEHTHRLQEKVLKSSEIRNQHPCLAEASLDLSFSPEKQGKALAWDRHVQEAAAVVPPADAVGWSVLPHCECMGRTGITLQAHHGMSFPGIGRVSQANRDTAPELVGLRGQGHQPTRTECPCGHSLSAGTPGH